MSPTDGAASSPDPVPGAPPDSGSAAGAASPVATSSVATRPIGGTLLRLTDVHTFYGHIHALQGISLEVRAGEIVTLLGANGAGKSTTLKTISGLLHPRTGTIEFDGADISRMPAHLVVQKGLGQSPEGRRIFGRMTVLENLQMGAYTRRDTKALETDFDRVFTLFPRLQERRSQAAGTLSGGEQQMLAMGRALMARPKLLLLDEPSMGLAPILVEQIFDIIRDINNQGTTILVVEQNALMALGVADRGYILQTGEIVLSDVASKLSQNPEVRRAYLGG
jgi:branched-chain amino acid transport system ATP-binding protein